MGKTKSKTLDITVAALTRNRPSMLSDLLDSFGNLNIPTDCNIRLLVVENDTQPSSKCEIERRNGKVAAIPLHYVIESQIGIPFGRNRAAKEALAYGSDLLAFVDDDEVVDPNWLSKLVAGYRSSDAILLGGPLAIQPPANDLTWGQRKLYKGLEQRGRKQERRAANRGNLNGTDGVTIVTNNWLGETRLFSEYGLRFDETMRFTGGTDTKFYKEVKAKNLPTAWVKDAYVYEEVPVERLSISYQFRRARVQSCTNFASRLKTKPNLRMKGLASLPIKAVQTLGLAILLLPSGGATLLELVRTSGWITGRIQAMRGRVATLYAETTGQ
ncbi:glycosyltransferase [Celeribacter sp. ULVN23_4]